MTRKELVSSIRDKVNLPESTIDDVVIVALSNIMKSVEKGDPVYLRGFGTFAAKTRKAKKAQHIAKRETIQLPERIVPHFKPSKSFKNSVNSQKQ